MKLLQALQETEVVLRGAPAVFLVLFVFSIAVLGLWTGFCWLMDRIS